MAKRSLSRRSRRNVAAPVLRTLRPLADQIWESYWIELLGPTPPKPPRMDEMARLVSSINDLATVLNSGQRIPRLSR